MKHFVGIALYKRAYLADTIWYRTFKHYYLLVTKDPMKPEIHPEVNEVTAHCACGSEFITSSTKKELRSTLCSKCHPFFTGDQKFVDTAGRIEKFKKKYQNTKA